MLKKVTQGLVIATFLSMPVVVSAGETPSTTQKVEIDAQRLDSARKLVEEMGLNNSYEKTIKLLTDDLVNRIPDLAPVKGKILDFYKKYIGWSAIKDDVVKVYAKHFTTDELIDLTKFYQTPTGKKALKEMPTIMMEGRKIGMQKVSQHMDELESIIKEVTKAKQTKQ
jgi:hypothetical protein